jgi:hypothetical protein
MTVTAHTNLQTWPSCRQSSSLSVDVQGTMHPPVRGTLNVITLQDIFHVKNYLEIVVMLLQKYDRTVSQQSHFPGKYNYKPGNLLFRSPKLTCEYLNKIETLPSNKLVKMFILKFVRKNGDIRSNKSIRKYL